MAFTHKGKKYNSKKHPILEHIFFKKKPKKKRPTSITFTLKDISEGYAACEIPEPASISNTILDLTRKKMPISSRLPESIYSLGYDLKKKTGASSEGNYAGEFVYVGVGNVIESWLEWPEKFSRKNTYRLSSANIPTEILPFIRNDEGALFSVIDYCDVLSQVLGYAEKSVIRIQNPLKWQPNEIDGFYYTKKEEKKILIPIEAKSLTTGDDINLEQMIGAMNLMCERYAQDDVVIQPIAVKMVKNGIYIAIFNEIPTGKNNNRLKCTRKISIKFSPEIENWT